MKKAFLNPVNPFILIIMVLTNCVSDGDLIEMPKPIDGVPISSSSEESSSSSEHGSSSSEEISSSSEESSSSSELSSSSSEEISSSSVESSSSSVNLCGDLEYDPVTHFCQSPDNDVKELCGGTAAYTIEQFCYRNGKVGDFCGNRTDVYDPNKYQCKTDINENGIYLKEPVSYQGKDYEAVLIGDQVWMAENLNYNVNGSMCGTVLEGEGTLLNEDTPTCDKYGRLYDWATAMFLPGSCNSEACSTYIVPNHKGICPSGWHIPSDADWDALMRYVQEDNGEDYSDGQTASVAGKYLKAASGWNNGQDGNGTDSYGFAALPGGDGFSDGRFYSVGDSGSWWSSRENNRYGIYRFTDSYFESMNWFSYEKSFLRSVLVPKTKKFAPWWCELVKLCVPRGLARETKTGKSEVYYVSIL
jgi:uncharacterized protein (TIGR02145 family)